MCTSFAVYASGPIYGMNFDFPEVEIRYGMASGSEGAVFCLSFAWDGSFANVAGMNERGLFGTGQVLAARFEIVPGAEDVPIRPYKVFSDALRTGERVEDVLALIGRQRLAYTTRRKGHQLYADRHGGMLIVEPGPTGNMIGRPEGFAVMTNFPNWTAAGREAEAVEGFGADRYRAAYRFIEEHPKRFGIDEGLEALERTALSSGGFRTQSSMVCDPLHGLVYVVVRRDFQRVWVADLGKRAIESFSGFRQHMAYSLDDGGVQGSQLI